MNGVDPALRALVHIESIGGPVLASMESAGSVSRTTAGERSVAVLLEWDGEIDRLERFGARIRSAGGGIVTADLPLSKVKQLSRLKAKYVELARPLRRELDVSLPEIRASLVHAATPANRGAGVIVGIIDSGIDFRHGAFKDVNDQTRIRSIWDQTLTPQANESSPSGFNYGVEYSMAKINQALAAANPATVVRHSDDEVGHGTHVAGIAAGDGSDPGLGKPAFTFVGVAPEAEIIFVANRSDTQEFGNSVTTLEAVRYIFARAGQLTRPCVINLSQGDNIGPHDGTSLLERGIDAELGAPGRAFVKSAGNEGASSRHAEGRVTDGGVEALILNVDVGDPTPEVIDIWYGANDKLGLSVTPPNGNASSVVAAGQNSTITLSNGNKVIVDSVVGDPRNGQNRIFVMLLPGNKPTLTGGNWTLTLHGATIAGDGGYHAWIERGSPAQTSHFVSAQRSTASTISIPGTAKKVITAGSFATNGTSAGNLSTFSSRGPTRDGRRAPTVCAPGQEITSVQALSAGSDIYAGMMGTSMAAPHVTGVIALMLSVNSQLAQADVARTLEQTARADAFTGPSPNDNNWGRGKIDAKAAVDSVPAGAQPEFAAVADARRGGRARG